MENIVDEPMPVLMTQWERRDYPECPKSIPMRWLSEDMARWNHSQTLKRLKERGGLSPEEIWLNMNGVRLESHRQISTTDAIKFINDKLKEH